MIQLKKTPKKLLNSSIIIKLKDVSLRCVIALDNLIAIAWKLIGVPLELLQLYDERHVLCINITLEDYNSLLRKEAVTNYDAYDKDAVYRIVESKPSISEIISEVYFNPSDVEEIINGTIFNNIAKTLADNVETEATFLSPHPPTVHIRDYERRIKPGLSVTLHFFVDTDDVKRMYYNEIGDTFTTIIKDPNDNVLFKGTTYAGEFKATFKFKKEITGETWFSIQTIDNHGVGSPTLFFDILIQEPAERVVYNMTAEDLTKYGIELNNPDKILGYNNKMGLRKLFLDVVNVKKCNEIKLYNPNGDDIYYIDYHINISKTPGEIDLGSQTFYLYKVEGGEIVSAEEITPGKEFTSGMDPNETVTVSDSPVDWVCNDGAQIYRDTSLSNKPIWVFWSSSNIWFKRTHKLAPKGERYLRTYRKEYFDSNYSKFSDNYYYIVENTVPFESSGYTGGEPLLLPDNFTLDLNGATLKAVPCYDIRIGGSVVRLSGNFNTHIKNGKLQGMYKWENIVNSNIPAEDRNYNFPKALISCGSGNTTTPVELVNVFRMNSSRYCSLEDVDISLSTGYESGVSALETGTLYKRDSETNKTQFDKSNPYNCTYPVIRFNKLGYIDYSGNVLTANAIVEPVKETSSDINIVSEEAPGVVPNISLVYTNKFIYCVPKHVSSSGVETPLDEIRIAPVHSIYYAAGKYHEFFVHFYDENYNFIKTVKTRMHYFIKVPANTKYIKMSGYGLSYEQDGEQKLPLDNYGRCKSLELIEVRASRPSRNTLYKNCTWHETRTLAILVALAKGHVFDHCNYYNIAVLPATSWDVSSVIGDFEEGAFYRDFVLLKDCKVTDLNSIYGKTAMNIYTTRNTTFWNTEKIGFTGKGGIESLYAYNSDISYFNNSYTYLCDNSIIIFKDSVLSGKNTISRSNNSQSVFLGASSYLTLRHNRCDNPVVNVIAIDSVPTRLIRPKEFIVNEPV